MNNTVRFFFKFLIISLTLISSSFVSAQTVFTPESGWWYNPNVNGRGYAIEIQDNVAFIATFTYDPRSNDSGVRRPIWFAAAGALRNHNIFEGTFDLYENGPCLGCSFTANSIHPSEKHTIRIVFNSSTSGTMTIDGSSFAIERFIFAPRYSNPYEKLLGEWTLTMTSPTSFTSSTSIPVSGDMIVLEEIEVSDDGVVNIWGCRKTTTTQAFCTDSDMADRLALARYVPDLDTYLILAADGTTHWRTYEIILNTEKIEGVVDRYSRTLGAYSRDRAKHVRGFRSASAEATLTGAGPAKSDQRISKAGFWDRSDLTEGLTGIPQSREEILESLVEALENRQ